MIAKCLGVFRGTKKIESSSFPGKNGKIVNVPERLEFKFDEEDDNSNVVERVFKVDISQVELISKLSQLKNYQKAVFEFEVEIKSFDNKQYIKLILIDVDPNIDDGWGTINLFKKETLEKSLGSET